MEKHAPRDIDGKDLQVGDWVRVVLVPLSIKSMPSETKDAFSNAVGHGFQIAAFDEIGCLEIEMWPKVSFDTIWLEPFCVRRFRRYKQLSKAFQKTLELRAAPCPPRYEVTFDITVKEGTDAEALGSYLMSLGTGGGLASWPDQRRITGSVYANKSEPDAIERLEQVRREILKLESIQSCDLGEIADAKDD